MTRIVAVTALALAAMLSAVTAQAQLVRTFVSESGSDSNPCTAAQPCRSFVGAYPATVSGGIITALDPGGYGPLTITGAITIDGQGWGGITAPSGGDGITINAGASDTVMLRGLNLTGISGGVNGVTFNTGSSLTVQNSVFRNFSEAGINFVPSVSSTPSQLFVSNTVVLDNRFHAIAIGSVGPITGVLNHVELVNNGADGLILTASTPATTIDITVSDSVSAHNGAFGILAITTGGGSASIMVRNSTIANNLSDGLIANGAGSTIRVTRSTITGNTTAWAIAFGGTVSSYDDNNIDGNGGANTAPPQIGYR